MRGDGIELWNAAWLILVVGWATTLVPTAAGAPRAGEVSADEEEYHEVLDLRPDDMASFGMRNLTAPVSSLFRGYGYWYGEREVEVETTPRGSLVDLFYVRSGFQKRFEQAETPVTIILPKRIEAGPRDSVTIRAFHEGYRQRTEVVKVAARTSKVVIDLEPLPNSLDALSHRYFAGRSAISFLTNEQLTFRIQEAADGFSVILTETAMSSEARSAVEGMRSPLVAEVLGQQLGEDLLVSVVFSDQAADRIEIRSRNGYDAARDLHDFTVELVPSDGGAEVVAEALSALGALDTEDVSGCALDYDSQLRRQLDPGALARALTPRGAFTDRYLRAAMRRLGEVIPGGVVEFSDGSKLRPAVGFELEVALSQAGGASGYLVLLREFVAGLEAEEFVRETLRSLIAPELDPITFGVIVDKAEAAEASCLASLALNP
jgi:hypothetical protein